MVAVAPETSVPITVAGFRRYLVAPSLSQATVHSCGRSVLTLPLRMSVRPQVKVAKACTVSGGGVSPAPVALGVAAGSDAVPEGAAAPGSTGAGGAAAAGPSPAAVLDAPGPPAARGEALPDGAGVAAGAEAEGAGAGGVAPGAGADG